MHFPQTMPHVHCTAFWVVVGRKNPENPNRESWSDPWEVQHPVCSLTGLFILLPSRSSCAPLVRFCWEHAGEIQQVTLLISYSKPWNAQQKVDHDIPASLQTRNVAMAFTYSCWAWFLSHPDFTAVSCSQLGHIMWSVLIKGAESEQCKISHYIVRSIYLLL